jgi:hypothetical protein
VQLTPTGLQGTAAYNYVHEDQCVFFVSCGDDYYHIEGSVDGTVDGDSFEMNAYWNNGTIGNYTGKIGRTGRIQGITYDRNHPQNLVTYYAEPVAKCLDGSAGTGGQIGTTSSALSTPPAPGTVRAQGRIKLPDGTTPKSTVTKCEAAARARARNSPAAPGLEASCAAERASGVSDGATATNNVRRVPPTESPTATMVAKFGAGGATRIALLATQPENSITVRVRYRKAFGYKGDTGPFGYLGPTSCDAFSISLAPPEGSPRQRDPYRISTDFKMADVGNYYVCNYLLSDIPLDQAMTVSVGISGENLSAAWNGGAEAQPPEGKQRTILDATRTAMLNVPQPRARLSYEMVYAPIGQR